MISARDFKWYRHASWSRLGPACLVDGPEANDEEPRDFKNMCWVILWRLSPTFCRFFPYSAVIHDCHCGGFL
ncbi:hypothetical protein SAMN06265380_101755 [Ruegeria faecimaris]|uniref:Uncharacterized protein n=1 Tax=Ruegeria faecimaris TaxID=686389 RepID=A0A521BCR9_9RHOB|nr:hypothetical protein SAMN06265380_101755 [Ruegeria faecimaris]